MTQVVKVLITHMDFLEWRRHHGDEHVQHNERHHQVVKDVENEADDLRSWLTLAVTCFGMSHWVGFTQPEKSPNQCDHCRVVPRHSNVLDKSNSMSMFIIAQLLCGRSVNSEMA